MGLLSTDLVYYESRSAYVVLSPDSAAQVEDGYQQMERALRERVGAAADGVAVRRSLDGRLLGQSWETPFVEVGDGPITAETMPALVERFHEAYERRYGNRFPYVPVQGVTYRVQLVVPADKVEHVARDGAGGDATPAPARTIELRHLADEPLQRRRVRARAPAGRRRRPRPGGHPRGAVDHLRHARPGRRGRPLRRDRRSRQGA